jgi:hypothetical protein
LAEGAMRRTAKLIGIVVTTASCTPFLESDDASFAEDTKVLLDAEPRRQSRAHFGHTLAAHLRDLLVTAPMEDIDSDTGTVENAGAVYLFEAGDRLRNPIRIELPMSDWDDGRMVLDFMTPGNQGLDGSEGLSIALNSTTLVVGRPGDDSGSCPAGDNTRECGVVFVYERSSLNDYPKVIQPDSLDQHDVFGISLALSNDTLAVGAPGDDSSDSEHPADNSIAQSGAVYIYQRRGGTFQEPKFLKAPEPSENSFFGKGLALDGDLLAVSSPERTAGSVDVFRFDGVDWRPAFPRIRKQLSGFGFTLDLSDGFLAIAAPFDETCPGREPRLQGQGAVFLFREQDGAWIEEDCVAGPAQENFDLFGWSLDLSGNRLIVGAPWDFPGSVTPNTAGPGVVYLYRREPSGNWQEVITFEPLGSLEGVIFGNAVQFLPGQIGVGAPRESRSSQGLASNSEQGKVPEAGAAFLFPDP